MPFRRIHLWHLKSCSLLQSNFLDHACLWPLDLCPSPLERVSHSLTSLIRLSSTIHIIFGLDLSHRWKAFSLFWNLWSHTYKHTETYRPLSDKLIQMPLIMTEPNIIQLTDWNVEFTLLKSLFMHKMREKNISNNSQLDSAHSIIKTQLSDFFIQQYLCLQYQYLLFPSCNNRAGEGGQVWQY